MRYIKYLVAGLFFVFVGAVSAQVQHGMGAVSSSAAVEAKENVRGMQELRELARAYGLQIKELRMTMGASSSKGGISTQAAKCAIHLTNPVNIHLTNPVNEMEVTITADTCAEALEQLKLLSSRLGK